MLTVSSSNGWVKWAYRWKPPEATSLCALFWNGIFNIVLVVSILNAVSIVLMALYFQPLELLMLVSMMLLAAAVIYGFGYLVSSSECGSWIVEKIERSVDVLSRGAITVENSLFMKWLSAIKHKVCPLVQIVE